MREFGIYDKPGRLSLDVRKLANDRDHLVDVSIETDEVGQLLPLAPLIQRPTVPTASWPMGLRGGGSVAKHRSRVRSSWRRARSEPLVGATDVAWVRRQSCETKARYGEYLAEVVAEEQSLASGETIESYECPFAPRGDPHWHIGHPSSVAASRRQSAAARWSDR
jgi:hypothetical protein